MTGSTVDGEDVVQDSLVKALSARAEGANVDNLEGWLFRIAHNTSLDLLRRRSRNTVAPLIKDFEAAPMPEADIVAVSFSRHFCGCPNLRRCAVILKDVLGHSVDEIASVTGSTPAAAKSALQRGRTALRQLARMPMDTRLPLMPDAARQKMAAFVDLFRTGDFDAIRAMLADDVKLELVNRLKWKGRKVAPYFTRYAEETKWRYAFGAVEGRPAVWSSQVARWRSRRISSLSIGAMTKSRRSAISCSLPMRSNRWIGRDWASRNARSPGTPRNLWACTVQVHSCSAQFTTPVLRGSGC